jgi:hypothetical protein
LYWIDYLGNMEKMKIGGHGKIFQSAFLCICFNVIALQGTAHTSALPLWTGATAAQTLPWRAHKRLTWLRYYKPDCSLEEAVALMAKCVPSRACVHCHAGACL